MSDAPAPSGLPRRDWLLLPLIAAITALLMLVAGEGISRLVWPEQKIDQCTAGMIKAKPDCVATVKVAQGPWVEERFNGCGYRATGPCGPVTPGVARIAVLGSSTSWGYMVPFDQVWSIRTAALLRARCGPIDVQGLGGFGSLNDVAGRVREVVALKPQLAALVIAPFDMLEMPVGGFHVGGGAASAPTIPPAPPSLIDRVKGLVSGSRATTVAQQYMYRDAGTYVPLYLNYGDRADFLRPPFTPAWAERLAYVDAAMAYLTAQLKAANIPLMLVYAPQQAQADIVAGGLQYPGVDGNALNRAVGKIAARYGALYVDGAQAFAGGKDAPAYFYRADGHLNGDGHALIAQRAAAAILAARPAGLCGRLP